MKIIHGALIPFSWLYGLSIDVRNWLYDHGYRRVFNVGVPVISVGNITVGGTGKTPLVAMIASRLCAEGKRVAIVSRGYRRKSSGPVIVSDGKQILTDALKGGDEPVELADKVPAAIVAVDARRVRVSRILVERWKPDLILMDDGFQHRALHRNCDCIVIDAQMLPDKTQMLPSGMRREPLRSLQRADIIILTKWQEGMDLDKMRTSFRQYTGAPVVALRYVPVAIHNKVDSTTLDVAGIHGRRCTAFCGIGSPGAFDNTLREMGVLVTSLVRFTDHHSYTQSDVEEIIRLARLNKAEMILTTEKDAMRLSGSLLNRFTDDVPLMTVEMAVKFIDGENLFWTKLYEVIQ